MKWLLVIVFVLVVFIACCMPTRVTGGTYKKPQVGEHITTPELDAMINEYADIDKYIYQTEDYLPTIQANLREFYSQKNKTR